MAASVLGHEAGDSQRWSDQRFVAAHRRFHQHLLKDIGAEILDAPADYPQYNGGNGYYAVFFADPDGLKLEYAWTPD